MIPFFTGTDYWLVGAFLLVMAYEAYFHWRYLAEICRQRRHRRKKADPQAAKPTQDLPGVSVIVCARNEETDLQDYLHTLLTQDYPKYEVIVVDDESEDRTEEVLKAYARQCENLYLTFVPHDARVLSSKKLAITIGAKAAHYDYLLLIDADCRPESRFWIREMMNGFAPYADGKTEVVLGYGAYFERHSLLSSLISYDTLFTAMQYMGMAAQGHPYMGVGRNLAYRRATFFAHDGFKGLLHERAGDDDLFVNKVATPDNTAIVCSRDSLTWSVPKKTWREWLQQKRRHLSVSPHYKVGSKWRLAAEPMARAAMYALMIGVFVGGSGVACCIVYGLWLIRLLRLLCMTNMTAHHLGQHRYGLEIILYEIGLPLLSLYMMGTQPLFKRKMRW